jgi:cell division protein FtsI/penicillin-binding protein 2
VAERSGNWHLVVRRRLFFASAIFVVWAAGIQARLVYLQVHKHADLAARAENQSARAIPISAKRGDILDRQGRVLAYSVDSDSIYAVPREVNDAVTSAAALCRALGDCSPKDREALESRLRQKRAFVYVRRQVTPAQAKRVADLGLDGVAFMKEDRRFYPKKELAAQLLGFVGVDNTGLAGLEAAYDSQISGTEGKLLYEKDARGHAFSRLERPPTAGATVELTIDEYVQHTAERELREAVAANKAEGGTVIVMNPKTGEILAMASEPTFNPNMFANASPDERRNRAVQDIYEPGSTFKVVTASAALQEHVVSAGQMIDASGGRIKIGSRVITDTHDYGVLSFTDVIVNSSNVGAIRVGLRVGAERLGSYARRFGFGRTLSPDFPGETAGILWEPAKLDDSALASMSMGYQVGVTALQMITAVSAVANGGNLIQPRVVKALIRDGKRIEVRPTVLDKAVDVETAQLLTGIMEQVVERGTAKFARIDGYTIAGKTGTAHKLINGHYSNTDYFASFAGFLPSRNPVVSVIVVIDSPHAMGHFGGPISGPVFQRIAQAALRHFGVPPTLNAPTPVLVERRQLPPEIQPASAAGDGSIVPAEDAGVPRDVPDLRGMSAREVVRRLTKIGVTARLHGSGLVAAQSPDAGTPIEPGMACDVWLQRALP